MRDPLNQARAARLRRTVLGAANQAPVSHLEALLKSPGEPGYNPNAEKPPKEWDRETKGWVRVAAMSPVAKHALERVLQRWPTVLKMLTPARKAGGKATKLHVPTDSAGGAKLS